MSIIHEALKKTNQGIAANETQKSKGPGSSEKSSVRPTVEVHRNRKTGGWGPLVVLVLCLLVAGPILAPRYFLKPSDSALSSQTTSPTQQFAVEEAPQAVSAAHAAFPDRTRP